MVNIYLSVQRTNEYTQRPCLLFKWERVRLEWAGQCFLWKGCVSFLLQMRFVKPSFYGSCCFRFPNETPTFQCDSSLSQSWMYRNWDKDYLYFVDMGGPDTHKEINKCLRWVPQWFFNGCQLGKLDWALPVWGTMILVWCWGICGFHLVVISQNGELRKIPYWLNHRIPHLEGTSWDDRARLLKVNA